MMLNMFFSLPEAPEKVLSLKMKKKEHKEYCCSQTTFVSFQVVAVSDSVFKAP